MIKFLQTADWHSTLKTTYGKSRFECIDLATDKMAEMLSKKTVSFIVLCGDIFDTVNPTEEERQFVSAQVKKLGKAGKVYWILGNHDKNELFSALGSTKILMGETNIKILIKPTIIKIDGYKFGFLSHSKDVPRVISEFNKEKVDVLFSHFSIIGGSVSSSNFKLKRWIDPKILSRFLYTGLGDLHTLQHKDRIWYSGSPVKVNFGERADVKGFLSVRLSKKKRSVKVKLIETPDLKMYMLKFSNGKLLDYSNMKEFKDYSGAILKIRYFHKDRDIIPNYKEHAVTSGARGVSLELIRVRDKGRKVKRIDYNLPFGKILDTYIKQDKTVKPKRGKRIFKYAMKVAKESGIF